MRPSQDEDNPDILQSLENFPDVVSWINETLVSEEEGEEEQKATLQDLSELEKRVSHLSAILEIACEDTSMQLEKTINTISRTVPRLTYDLQLMQENALSLKSALQLVEHHSDTFLNTKEMSPVLEQLFYLDTVKRNMNASLAVLREAESWSSLESEAVSFLSEQAYSKAASRLSEASKSLGVFQNTPEFETRKTLMTNLQNQLEASLSSALVAAINTNDVDACKNFFNIFRDIERESEFRSYWNGSKRKDLAILWQSARLRDCEETNNEGSKFSAFLPDFYQSLLSVLQVERLSASLIFPDPQATLSTFISSALTSLHPLPSVRLSQITNYYGDFVLPELISAFRSTEEFALSTSKLMEKVGFSSFSPPNASSTEEGSTSQSRVASRRRSTRQSFSRRVNRSSVSGPSMTLQGLGPSSGSSALDHSWEETLFEPFIEYQCDYATLEKRLLRSQLKNVIAATSASASGARLLREGAVDVLSCADESLTRCMTFTHGYGLVGLIQALDDLFDSFLQSVKNDVLSVSETSRSTDPGSSITGQELVELDLDDSDYSAEDLATVQLVLHLLDSIRSVLERVLGFEVKLRSSIMQTSSVLRMARADPFATYISGTTSTVLSLLQSSTLNSIELQTLLDLVDPEHPQTQAQQLAVAHSAFNTPNTPAFPSMSHTIQSQGSRHPPGNQVQLLLGARSAISVFAQACQKRLRDTLLSPLFKHLASYSSLPVWGSIDSKDDSRNDQKRPGQGNATSEVVIPTFSLSPTASIQRIAEGLLSLPRLFEVYADDDALAFSIETLPFVDSKSVLALSNTTDNAPTESNTTELHTSDAGMTSGDPITSSRPKPQRLNSSSSSISSKHPSSITPTPTLHLSLSPEAVSSLWLSSLSLSVFSHLTTQILPSLPRLSARGSSQLVEDLSYLSQIGRALGVEWPALEAWREAVSMDGEELRRRLSPAAISEEKPEVVEILRVVSKIRG